MGQTRGDYVGCYLMGVETQGQDEISYISLAISRSELEVDARNYLENFLQQHAHLPEQELGAVRLLLTDLGPRLDVHLAGDMRLPLAEQGASKLFLRTGMRASNKPSR